MTKFIFKDSKFFELVLKSNVKETILDTQNDTTFKPK